jgi:hypothetical protein
MRSSRKSLEEGVSFLFGFFSIKKGEERKKIISFLPNFLAN